MDPLIAELKHQYHSTLAMYESLLEGCSDEIWDQEYAGVLFWREAYHALFWLHTFLGFSDKTFHPWPFGKDIDPQLYTPPNNACERAEALQYVAQTKAYIDEVLKVATLGALNETDLFEDGEFRTVYHRLLYGLRHGQHHIGKLTAYLNLEGVRLHHWRG
jgi:hypothetical protein